MQESSVGSAQCSAPRCGSTPISRPSPWISWSTTASSPRTSPTISSPRRSRLGSDEPQARRRRVDQLGDAAHARALRHVAALAESRYGLRPPQRPSLPDRGALQPQSGERGSHYPLLQSPARELLPHFPSPTQQPDRFRSESPEPFSFLR